MLKAFRQLPNRLGFVPVKIRIAMSETKSHPLPSFLVCQTICFAASFIGSQATFIGLQAWYPALAKPAFNPPSWVFAPVWTILYFLMGVALFQIWRSESSRIRTWGLWLFGFQLTLNALWSWIFFGWFQLKWAFVEIVVLNLAILATIVVFRKVKPSAAWLLTPYLAWTLFATVLTYSIWRLNPTDTDPKNENIQIQMGEPELTPLPEP